MISTITISPENFNHLSRSQCNVTFYQQQPDFNSEWVRDKDNRQVSLAEGVTKVGNTTQTTKTHFSEDIHHQFHNFPQIIIMRNYDCNLNGCKKHHGTKWFPQR